MVEQEQIVDSLSELAKGIMDGAPSQTSVLVVDDETSILSSMTDLLEDHFRVLTSSNSEAALKILEAEQIAVIIADQRMPGLTGDEFLSRARNLSHATRILITGYADINALIRAVNMGQIYTYIAKPWDPAELRLAVIKAAEHCRLTNQVDRERSLLHALMNNVPDAIWFKDNAYRYTQVNKAAASLLGINEPAAAIGKTSFDFLPADQAREIQAQEENVLRVGRAQSNEIEELHFNGGGTKWMSTTRAPVLERTGGVAALVGISRDVTDQKRAELALQKSEEKYRQIVETAAEGVWIFNEQLKTIFVNAEMAAMLGYDQEEMLGKPVSAFMPPAETSEQLEHFKLTHLGKTTTDLRLRKKDGTLIWTMLSSSPMIDASGRQTGTLAMLSDVTRRRELEQKFLQAQKMEVVGRLAAGIAHDFNNLLTVINTYSQLLLGRFNERHPAWREIHEIHSAGERSASLTQRLLAMGRQPQSQPKLFDLNMMIAGLQHILKRLIGDEIRLTMRLAPDTSAVDADPEQIEHIVMNLSINARDAMQGSGELLIATANRRLEGAEAATLHLPPGRYVELSVTDTGHGMDEATKTKIFDAFFTTKDVSKGTGLGLWMAREIVERSKGAITVDSIPGQGSNFRIFLPQAAKLAESVHTSAEERALPACRQTILLIEEDLPTQQLIKDTLARMGYRVLLAGEDEAESIASQRGSLEVDLLICGLGSQLPGNDPVTRLAAGRPDMRMLFLFNGEDVLGDREPWPAGVAYLQKPFNPSDLVEHVGEVLDAPADFTIVIADDDRAIRALLGDVLRPLGYRVIEAANGNQAMSELQKHRVDLLITDLVMPDQEGLATIRAAKKGFQGLKIIAMSGGFGEKYLDLAKVLGADEILAKPFRLEVLRKAVRRLASGNRVSTAQQ